LLAIGQQEAISTENLFGPSCTWISATPFIATRYQKSNGRKKDVPDLLGTGNKHAFARHVLVEEIKRLRERQPDIPVPISVEPLNNEHRCSARQLRPFEFRCFRQKRGDDGGWRAAGAFKIIFPEPVRGPITLGHSNHFGLGLFVPLDEKKNSPQ
jgi:CRISPR-associated protein Csb2